MSGICRIEFREASNVKVLVEKVRRGRRECGKREGGILQILIYTSPRADDVLTWDLISGGVGVKKCVACILLVN